MSTTAAVPQQASDARKQMSLAEKVGQITQLDILQIVDYDEAEKGNFKLDHEKLQKYIQAGVGSYLNSPTAGGTIEKLVACDQQQWQAFTQALQQAYRDAGKVC